MTSEADYAACAAAAALNAERFFVENGASPEPHDIGDALRSYLDFLAEHYEQQSPAEIASLIACAAEHFVRRIHSLRFS